METTIKLTIQEVNALLQMMGDLPTKTMVYPLMIKIKAQAEEQLIKPENKEES